MQLPEPLLRRIDAVNRCLRTDQVLPNKLEAVAELIERILPDCDAVSIGIVAQGLIATGAASGQLAVEADLVQYDRDEGPCLSSALQVRSVRIDVLGQDERFVHFAAGAMRFDVASTLSIPLRHGDSAVGSVNLYSRVEHGFAD